jgi:hypothetical protein
MNPESTFQNSLLHETCFWKSLVDDKGVTGKGKFDSCSRLAPVLYVKADVGLF